MRVSLIIKQYCCIVGKEARILIKTSVLPNGNSNFDLTFATGKECLTVHAGNFDKCKKANCMCLGGTNYPFTEK